MGFEACLRVPLALTLTLTLTLTPTPTLTLTLTLARRTSAYEWDALTNPDGRQFLPTPRLGLG